MISASTFQKVFVRLSIELHRLVSASEVVFLDALPPLGLGGSEVGAVFWCRFLHDLCSRAGNFIGLLSNTAILLFTGTNTFFLFQCHLFHGIHPPQLQQLRKGSVLYSANRYSAISNLFERRGVDLDFSIIPSSTSQINAKFQEMIPCWP